MQKIEKIMISFPLILLLFIVLNVLFKIAGYFEPHAVLYPYRIIFLSIIIFLISATQFIAFTVRTNNLSKSEKDIIFKIGIILLIISLFSLIIIILYIELYFELTLGIIILYSVILSFILSLLFPKLFLKFRSELKIT